MLEAVQSVKQCDHQAQTWGQAGKVGDGQNKEEDTGAGEAPGHTALFSQMLLNGLCKAHETDYEKVHAQKPQGKFPDLQTLETAHSHDNIQAIFLMLSAPRFSMSFCRLESECSQHLFC